MGSPVVVLLHGFLGAPNDWHPIQEKLKSENINSLAIDIVKYLTTSSSLNTVATQLLTDIKKSYPAIDLLCGYSMGGRIALEMFSQDSQFCKKLIMCSAHPGLPESSTSEKKQRLENDLVWSQKFSNGFQKALPEWNSQKIFEGSSTPSRSEFPWDQTSIDITLKNLSLGNQSDLTSILVKNSDRTTWVCGEKDSKYSAMALEYRKLGITINVIPNSGHRVIFDAPLSVAQIIAAEIKKATN